MIEKSNSIEQNHEGFSAMEFINKVAAVSRSDGKIPDEKTVGRECHAFSEQEDAAFRVAEVEARKILTGFNEGEDFSIEHDAIGNMFIRFGNKPNKKAVLMGSHLDSVASGGKYDGVAGVAMALQILRDLAQQSEKLAQDFVVAVWRSEESSPKNGRALVGSAIAAGRISETELQRIQYEKGVPLRDHIERRYGTGQWEKVLKLARNPCITKEKYAMYLEPHIEQSSVIEKKEKDIGIVTGGIGGARRDRVDTGLPSERINTSAGRYTKVTMRFLGEAAHTGGTPPNPAFFRENETMVWYRKDALVASCFVTNKMLHDDSIRLLSSAPKSLTGFTSVPSYQLVELLVPTEKLEEFRKTYSRLKSEASALLNIDTRYATEPFNEAYADVANNKRAREILNIPQVVSIFSTKAFKAQGTETGTTRATITDFVLRPDGVGYNLDLREVSIPDLDKLVMKIHTHTERHLGKGSLKTLSLKVHAPIDEGLVRELEVITKKLGISFVLMSSMPGHDAGNIADVGIPTAMLYIRHDGRSHHPAETITERDFMKAAKVATTFILDYGKPHANP